MVAHEKRSAVLMTYEEEILATNSTPRLRRNILPRHAKKLNMEFDSQFNKMTKADRDEFLDAIYPDEKDSDAATPTPSGQPAAEKAETEADS
jgi:hypothetical protein